LPLLPAPPLKTPKPHQKHAPLRRALQAIDTHTARARIAAYDQHINAFVRTSPPHTEEETQGVEGSLKGWPIAIKDSMCAKDMGTGGALRMLQGLEPGYDATPVRLLRAQGAEMTRKEPTRYTLCAPVPPVFLPFLLLKTNRRRTITLLPSIIVLPRTGSGRGVAHGRIDTRDGVLVAITSQEGVVRANMQGAVDDSTKVAANL
ncbi:hypothetical protein DXG01_002885, partial [Tephrocybe rancida]